MTAGKLPLGAMTFAASCFLALAVVLAQIESSKRPDRAAATTEAEAAATKRASRSRQTTSISSGFDGLTSGVSQAGMNGLLAIILRTRS